MAKLKTPFVAGIFEDPDAFVHAAEASTKKGWSQQHEGFMPYPIHAAFGALGIKRSLLGRPILAILLIGATLGFFMQLWMLKMDWPILISGKPYNSWPAFVVITFESGIIMGAVSNFVLVLTAFCKLFPSPFTRVIRNRLTDDQFCLGIPLGADGRSEAELQAFFAEHGADEVFVANSERLEPAAVLGHPFQAPE